MGKVETMGVKQGHVQPPTSNVQPLVEKNLSSAFRSDPLEIGGRIDVEGAFLEFNLGDISGTGFDERFRTRVSLARF